MNTLSKITVALLALLLTACGGGGSSDTTANQKTSLTGYVVDAGVSGLGYECTSGASGTTDKDGKYICETADKVKLYLGDTSLGEVIAQEYITPQYLFPNDEDTSLNFAQLLQTLDNDGDLSNGIDINITVLNLLDSPIDFTSSSFDEDIQGALGNDIVLVPGVTAQEHLNDTFTSLGIKSDGTPIPAPMADTTSDEETIISHNSVTYETVVSPFTEKIWLDRNLGASQVCTGLDDTACYGDYYQWGRDADGHEKLGTTTQALASDVSNVGHGDFIIHPVVDESKPNDWAQSNFSDGSIRTLNWSKADGSSVCPTGFRVPTIEEIDLEVSGITNNTQAYENFLKLPSAGFTPASHGTVYFAKTYGTIWSTTVDGVKSKHFGYSETYVQKNNTTFRGGGFSVRCIKE